MIRVIWLTLVLICFGLPGSNFVAHPCSGNPVNESTVRQSRRMSQLAVDLAEHVVDLIEKESRSGQDPLAEEARKLQPEIQRQLQKDLSKKLGISFGSREKNPTITGRGGCDVNTGQTRRIKTGAEKRQP